MSKPKFFVQIDGGGVGGVGAQVELFDLWMVGGKFDEVSEKFGGDTLMAMLWEYV